MKIPTAKKLLKKELVLSAGLLLFLGTVTYFNNKHYMNDEYRKGKALDELAETVLPGSEYESANYLVDGKNTKVFVWNGVGYRLAIQHDNIEYVSRAWHAYRKVGFLDGPDEDARTLDLVKIPGSDGAFRTYNMNELPNASEFQSKYESQLRKIYGLKIEADETMNNTILNLPR